MKTFPLVVRAWLFTAEGRRKCKQKEGENNNVSRRKEKMYRKQRIKEKNCNQRTIERERLSRVNDLLCCFRKEEARRLSRDDVGTITTKSDRLFR